MLIISWNVAGLSTTVTRIHDAYNIDSDNNKKLPASSALTECMRRHGADIFCLQEHKIPLSQLSTRSEPRGCSTVEGYESFWSCCVDQNKRGLNGVVTFVKQGMACQANSKPLGSPDLDEQGRCVMTDHGSFVIFNVYVPAIGGQPLSYKMKFLNALRRAMKKERDNGKAVMLVGDLNITHTHLDLFWKDRAIFINDVLKEVENKPKDALPEWKLQLAEGWPKIDAALQTKEVVATQTTNSLTNQKYDKFRLCVTVDGKQVYLGKNESSQGHCNYYYDFGSRRYVCADTDEEILAEEENVVSLGTLSELLSKLAGITWDETLLRTIGKEAARASRVAPPRKWLDNIIEQDGMIDTFRHFYPDAEGRFTCWDQFRNRRYFNEGCRIDYTIVDASLMQFVQKGSVPSLRSCGSEDDPLSEAAALCAATANGRFQPVSFEGGGITECSQEALDTQFGPPHTGMIYTPPSFSDHIAISLLLDDSCCFWELVLDEKDTSTKKAQPHKSQKLIAAFFGAPSSASKETKPVAKPLTIKQQPVTQKRKGIQNFFKSRSADDDSIDDKRNKVVSNGVVTASKPTTSATPRTALQASKKKAGILSHFQKK